jgi:hypothetical protein
MPRRKTHNGRRGYPVFPEDWGARLAVAANRTHTDTCEIRSPDSVDIFDPNTGNYVSTPGALRYTGACRVQPQLRTDQGVLVTEQDLPGVSYLVSIDYESSTVQVNDVVTVLTGDPALLNQKLYVKSVSAGTQRVTRDLICTDDQST